MSHLLLPVDCEMTFEEYKDQLFRSAENVEIDLASHKPELYYRGAQSHLNQSTIKESEGNYEGAFHGYIRTVTLLKKLGKSNDPLLLDALTRAEGLRDNMRAVFETRLLEVQREASLRDQARLDILRQEHAEERKLLFAEEGEKRNSLFAVEVRDRQIMDVECKDGYRRLLMMKKAQESEAMRRKFEQEEAERVKRLQELQAARAAAATVAPPVPQFVQRRMSIVKCDPWVFPNNPPSVPRRGLVNLGNTCYMNATLQCLNAVQVLKVLIGQWRAGSTPAPVTAAYQWINMEMVQGRTARHAISPSYLKQAIATVDQQFAGTQQQDCHEFLRVLLDTMHEEMRPRGAANTPIAASSPDLYTTAQQYLATNNTAISQVFGHFETSTLTCPGCNKSSVTHTPSFTLLLPIPQGAQTLYDCLGAYTSRDELPADGLWNCPSCNKKVRAFKQLSFGTSPNTLIITLVRFQSIGVLSNKVTVPILFPQILDHCGNKYRLVGTANHQGTISGGHYTADVLGEDGAWLNFSDERVSRCALQPQWSQAYVLYYVSVNQAMCGMAVQPPPPPQPQKVQNNSLKMEEVEDWIKEMK